MPYFSKPALLFTPLPSSFYANIPSLDYHCRDFEEEHNFCQQRLLGFSWIAGQERAALSRASTPIIHRRRGAGLPVNYDITNDDACLLFWRVEFLLTHDVDEDEVDDNIYRLH